MSELWPTWLRPLWLMLLPLLIWLLWRLWHRQRRVGRWQALLPPAFHAALLSGGNGQAGRLRWVVLGLAWMLALLALLGPSWQRVEQPDLKPVAPLVAILELTPRMLAGDAPPSRLEQSRRKLLDLLEVRRDAQTALVVYAGSAHTLVPLSDDLATTRNLLEALKPSIMPEPGQRADLALQRALQLLDQGTAGRGRVLLISSGLSEMERAGIRAIMSGRREQLDLLGVGTAQGAPVIAEDGGFLKDDGGAILLPRLDIPGLRRFAGEIGAGYQSLRIDDGDLAALGLLAPASELRDSGSPILLARWADQGYWLLLPLLLLAAAAGRRGWLFGLALLLVPPSSQAFEFEDLWLRREQQGQRLLEAQRPAEAATRFEDPQRQGHALYLAGDYPAAAERFALDDSAGGHYNRGNALARAGQLEAAIDAYEQALERQPDLQQARSNKALVEELLRQRKAAQSAQQNAQPPQQTPPQSEPEGASTTGGERGGQQASDAEGQPGEDSDGEEAQQQPSAEPEADADADAETDPVRPDEQPAEAPLSEEAIEHKQAKEQWLRQIPDDPGELLRRKFWYEQQQRQEQTR